MPGSTYNEKNNAWEVIPNDSLKWLLEAACHHLAELTALKIQLRISHTKFARILRTNFLNVITTI